jgi:hypothetical protein
MNMTKLTFVPTTRLKAVIALAALALLVPISVAQTRVSVAQAGDGPHPNHIHAGTCSALGDVVAPLTDVAGPAADAERMGAATAHEVKTGRSEVDMSLQEIIDGGYTINVHKSADEIGEYIACGDIGGVTVTDEDGRTHLIIGLDELNDSGHTGVAWLGADGDVTEVVVMLIEPDSMN